MTFKANGKGLIIVFKANSSGMGSVNVTVNGKTTKVNGNKIAPNVPTPLQQNDTVTMGSTTYTITWR